MPDGFLTDEVPQHLAQHWSAWPGADWRLDVACQGPEVVGFVATDLAHTGGPYVDNLHVVPGVHRQGLGRGLMARAARHAQAQNGLWLTVICDNTRAREFYRSIGGAEGEPVEEHLFGHAVQAVPVRWSGDALAVLAAQAAAT